MDSGIVNWSQEKNFPLKCRNLSQIVGEAPAWIQLRILSSKHTFSLALWCQVVRLNEMLPCNYLDGCSACCPTCRVGKPETIMANMLICFPLKRAAPFYLLQIKTDRSFSCEPKTVMGTRWKIWLLNVVLIHFESHKVGWVTDKPWASPNRSMISLSLWQTFLGATWWYRWSVRNSLLGRSSPVSF